MFSTPLICCSIGVTTVEATTSALAPGYWPVMVMVGGEISGYCAIGSRAEMLHRPRMTITIETTEAKIGRSMKEMGYAHRPDAYYGFGAAPAADGAAAAPCSCGVTFWPAARASSH